jgi:hypothetical protein
MSQVCGFSFKSTSFHIIVPLRDLEFQNKASTQVHIMADLKVHEVWKYVVQHKKKDEIDEETFLKWYKEELMPECVRLLKKHNIPRFSVVCQHHPYIRGTLNSIEWGYISFTTF